MRTCFSNWRVTAMLKALLRVRMAALGKWFTGATAKKGKQTKGSMIGFAF